ncbi:hypothetical protein [Pseudomonas chlororaphis]|uniref:hypothetical protein n=1 Tax=Pseudomonas chlororaphis TaxID=587753 RepID=UPI001B312F89|nr:hypothetical protein [Pseudomonas chlororaphis]MBP5058509.1 hypothetical protein [Pseudomonas chlororaphis]MBP5137391.1 hypothetical protein [Pseudomonas chlororaphis]QTT99267.1 hypothetical protein HUT26_08285 [Pseudomonas chlororaphis]
MSTTETSAPIPTVPERITIVLKAQEGSTLEQICQFVSLGMPVAIGRGVAVIAGASDEDLQMVLGEERDDRQMQAELQQQALGAPSHLAAHAQEMFDLLRRIDAKCGGLDAALGHGIEPSEQMWAESREAMEAIWELQDKIQSAASVDPVPANTITPPQGGVLGLKNGEVIHSREQAFNIDDHIRLVADAERYRWLRDRNRVVDIDTDLCVARDDTVFFGHDLDKNVDDAMRLARLEELQP